MQLSKLQLFNLWQENSSDDHSGSRAEAALLLI
jgi:hypothetical protein